MEKLTVEIAKAFLKKKGYYVDNMWHVDDVKGGFVCTRKQAQKVLDGVLTNEYFMSEINNSIESTAEDLGYVKIDDDEDDDDQD